MFKVFGVNYPSPYSLLQPAFSPLIPFNPPLLISFLYPNYIILYFYFHGNSSLKSLISYLTLVTNGTHISNHQKKLVFTYERKYTMFVFLGLGCLMQGDCFQLNLFTWDFIIFFLVIVYFFMCKYTTFSLSSHQLMDILPLSNFWLLWIEKQWTWMRKWSVVRCTVLCVYVQEWGGWI